MDLAVLIDRNMLAGLHVVLYSALAQWDLPEPLHLHLFHENLNAGEIAALEKTLILTERPFTFDCRRFSTESLGSLRPFHGSFMVYGVLLLPQLLPDLRSVLYVDSDVLFTLPVSKLLAFDPALSEHHLVAACSSTFESTLDRDLACSLGLDCKAPYFNSGVLYLNLELWCRDNITEKCIEFCKKHLVFDQTALNVVFYNRFKCLPSDFNVPLYIHSSKLADPSGKILHFVGSPKPFDFLGDILNPNSKLFNAVLAKTAFSGYRPNALSHLKLKRIVALRRSYCRAIRDRFFRNASDPQPAAT